MSSGQAECLIWGFGVESAEACDDGTIAIRGSLRAGGDYKVSADVVKAVPELGAEAKARLTYRLVKARQMGIELPIVDALLVDEACVAVAASVHERAVGLLEYAAAITKFIGKLVYIEPLDKSALAWSESVRSSEVNFLFEYLENKNWIIGREGWNRPKGYMVTADGYSYLEEQRTVPATSQAFVAMWFDGSMDDVYAQGIKLAVENCGYSPLRIDRTEHINKVDDEIIRELRRSRFVVADFTSGEGGARGSVYYEAGFARGLGIPVISTCRRDKLSDVHFDTRQYAHIAWDSASELRDALEARIGAVIGEGPHAVPPQSAPSDDRKEAESAAVNEGIV